MSNCEIAVSQEWEGRLTWNERNVSRLVVGPTMWPYLWPWTWIFKIEFSSSHASGMKGSVDLEQNGCESAMMLGLTMQPWVCHMTLRVGYSTYQVHWPSNGLMQNCYRFQPVGPLMGCPLKTENIVNNAYWDAIRFKWFMSLRMATIQLSIGTETAHHYTFTNAIILLS